jgi:uncharacterized damage-inducible protein DinB
MIRKIEDFLAEHAGEVERTKKVLAHLTDASLSQQVAPKGRTLGFLAWHLVTTIGELAGSAGLSVKAPKEDAPVPQSARVIADAYATAAASVAPAVRAAWKDAQLEEKIPMYGEQWPRRQVLLCLLMHEAHHRGQMTILMRQAGLKVPGIYGPAFEEWAEMGMQPQA